MKIGIITWYGNLNYGSVLQAFALQKYLKDTFKADVELIDYKCLSGDVVCNYQKKAEHFAYKTFEKIEHRLNENKYNYATRLKSEFADYYEKKQINFSNILSEIKFTDPICSQADFEKCKDFDVIICGSDQIWNPQLLDKNYFLAFGQNVKKIAYATSFGIDYIPKYSQSYIKEWLKDFKAVGLREDTCLTQLKKTIKRNDITTVCDPCLLYTASEWESFFSTDINRKNYFVTYFLGTNELGYYAENRLKNKLSISNVVLPATSKGLDDCEKESITYGPAEFIYLVKNSEFVVTDSFHAVIFSLIFEKDFCVVYKHKKTNPFNQNSRIDFILKTLGLSDRIAESESDVEKIINTKIDYSLCRNKIADFIKHSKEFLKDNILQHKPEYICESDKCTGCSACVSVCPVMCIEIKTADDLCERAVIDSSKCIGCNKCVNICPVNNPCELNRPVKAIVARRKNLDKLKNSTSGGIAAAVSEKIIENGGVVYSTVIDKDLRAKVVRCDSSENLERFKGSKYVYSQPLDSFKNIVKDLKENKTVLFVGTPCQIAGLKKVASLNNCEDNLFTIDLICHGVPSQEVFLQYSKYILKENYEKAVYCKFRSNKDYVLTYLDENGKTIKSEKDRESLYVYNFLDGFSLRKNCHTCSYAQPNRSGDITLGDVKGHNAGDFDTSLYGLNSVLINSQKGLSLFDSIKDETDYFERDIDTALKENNQLNRPCEATEESKRFEVCCKEGNAVLALKKSNTKKYFMSNLRKCINRNKILKSVLMKIKFLENKI